MNEIAFEGREASLRRGSIGAKENDVGTTEIGGGLFLRKWGRKSNAHAEEEVGRPR